MPHADARYEALKIIAEAARAFRHGNCNEAELIGVVDSHEGALAATGLTVENFAVGDRVHVEGWGSAEFVVTGHIWSGLVRVADPDGGISGHEPPDRLTKVNRA